MLTCLYIVQETKPHRQIPLTQILDAFEYDAGPGPGGGSGTGDDGHGAGIGGGGGSGLGGVGGGGVGGAAGGSYVFKVVTTGRALVLCAPSEEEEIRWLSAVRALLARRTEAPGSGGGRRTSVSGHGMPGSL